MVKLTGARTLMMMLPAAAGKQLLWTTSTTKGITGNTSATTLTIGSLRPRNTWSGTMIWRYPPSIQATTVVTVSEEATYTALSQTSWALLTKKARPGMSSIQQAYAARAKATAHRDLTALISAPLKLKMTIISTRYAQSTSILARELRSQSIWAAKELTSPLQLMI